LRHLPNLLTASRLVAGFFAFRAILSLEFTAALALAVAAGVTDALDGYLARRFGWTSRLGAWIDPIADKILLSGAFLCLGAVGAAPAWVVYVVLGRDVWILVGATMVFALTKRRDFPPSLLGKASTAVQIVNVAAVLASKAVPALALAANWLYYATAVMAVLSAAYYTGRVIRAA
jgi:cardiolipin synthase